MNLATKIALSASATALTAFQAYVSYVLVERVTALEKSRALVCVIDESHEPIDAPENLAACVRDNRGRMLVLGKPLKSKKVEATEPVPATATKTVKKETAPPPKPSAPKPSPEPKVPAEVAPVEEIAP